MYFKRLYFLILLFFTWQTAIADTFIVTSNANSGSGTLREAITMANANGTTIADIIRFNISDISQSGRTINLQSELPALSSNITIDASTQSGSMFGISNSKIILFLDHYTPFPFTYIYIQNATNVNIFSICFGYFENPDNGGSLNYAIGTRNSSDITIGSPGKGNLFSGVRMSITNSPWNYFNDSVSNMIIQGNVFGQNLFSQNDGRGIINLINAANILIGGNLPEEGNIFISASIILNETANSAFSFFTTIKNNRFGANWDGTIYYNSGGIIELWGNITDIITLVKTEIKNNLITRGEVRLHQLYHTTIVQGNKIGTNVTGLNCIDVVDIGTGNCKQVIIGGHLAGEENIVNGNIYSPRHGTHIIKNIISGYYGSNTDPDPAIDPFIKILTYTNNLITGTANPNAKIQLYTINCNTWCRSKTYAATVFANGSGSWSFPYVSTDPNFVATATTADSSTSEFSKVKYDHITNRVIKHATCGKNNGSITGITVFQGTHIGWYNSNTMQLVSTDTNLVNVPAGSYVFIVSNGANGCPVGSNFVIEDLRPPPSPYSLNVVNPSCGINNGLISSENSSYGSKWMNSNMDSIGTGNLINHLFAGTYYLKLWIPYDTSCNKVYGPFTITNQSGPSLNFDNIQLNAATCTNANGNIRNITSSNVTGTPFIQWLDSLNMPVGNTLDLQNMSAGKYRLKFKDQSSCDTIITPFYIISATGLITIDTSIKVIRPAGCTVNNGSIQNIQVSGETTLQWQNLSNNLPAGTTSNINNLSSGNYQLTATNSIGCSTSVTMFVPPAAFLPIGVTGVRSRNANCGENNGSISILSFNNNQSLYNFKWVDSTTNQGIATGTSAINLGAGTFLLFATDTNGCEKQIFKNHLVAYPKPGFDYNTLKASNDQCSLGNGSISGISVSNLFGPTTFYWENINNNVVGNSLNLNGVGAGQYRLTVTDGGLCTIYSDWIILSNVDIVLPPSQYDEQTIIRNTTAVLTIRNFKPGTYFLYSDAGGTQELQQNTSGVFKTGNLTSDTYFYVKRIDGSCSSAIVPVKVYVIDKTGIYVPSAFTPNNDGKNDKLKVITFGPVSLNYFTIYNRWGEIVFTTNNLNTGWDGKFKGVQMDTGIFVWMVKAKDELTGSFYEQKGTVTLIR